MKKCTLLFGYNTPQKRAGGWSETWYIDATQLDAQGKVADLANFRAALLGNKASIIGTRIGEVGGRAQAYKLDLVGGRGTDSDIPQMAINTYMDGQTANTRKYFQLRGLPDARVENGDFVFNQDFINGLNAFFRRLTLNSFRFRAIDQTQPAATVLSVAADGTFVLEGPLTFAVNDYLQVLRMKNSAGQTVSGNFVVIERTDDKNGKLGGWTGGVVGRSGKVRKLAYVYPICASGEATILKVTTRKVGRPFDSYRGRVSTKR